MGIGFANGENMVVSRKNMRAKSHTENAVIRLRLVHENCKSAGKTKARLLGSRCATSALLLRFLAHSTGRKSRYTKFGNQLYPPPRHAEIVNKLAVLVPLATIISPPHTLQGQVPPEKVEGTFTVHNPEPGNGNSGRRNRCSRDPTSMDIDHLGRIWVCESVNYRTSLHKKPLNRPAGDRIVILEDSKGTGKADKATTFYQSRELLAPIGIAVAKDPVGPGWKVYVCQSPDILVFEDKDGDGKADGPPKKLLTGFKGTSITITASTASRSAPTASCTFPSAIRASRTCKVATAKRRKWTTSHTADCQAGTDLDAG